MERSLLMALVQRLCAVFSEALELGLDTDPARLRYRNHPNWDSLGHMALVVAIEDEFGVEIDAEQLIQIDSFDAAAKVLRDAGIDD
jgi:acyl carrier protein